MRYSVQALLLNRPSPYLYSFNTAPTFHLSSNHWTSACLKISQFGDERYWLEISTVCWESVKSELILVAESIGRDADDVSTDEFDAPPDNVQGRCVCTYDVHTLYTMRIPQVPSSAYLIAVVRSVNLILRD